MADLIKLDAARPQRSEGSSHQVPEGLSTEPAPPIKSAIESKPASLAGVGGAPVLTQSIGNIFTQTTQKEKDPQLLATVLSQKESRLAGPKSILGVAPTLEKTIALEKELRLKRRLRFAKFLLLLTFLGGLGMAGYFYVELSPTFNAFGLNTTQRLANLNDNLRQGQTDVNKYRYLMAQLKLNEFSYQVDQFLSNVTKKANSDNTTGVAVSAQLEEAKTILPALLNDIRANVTADIVVQTAIPSGQSAQSDSEARAEAEVKLRDALRAERKPSIRPQQSEGPSHQVPEGLSISKESKETKENNLTSEEIANLKLIDNAIKLVGNKSLLAVLRNISMQNFSKDLADYVLSPDDKKLKSLRELTGNILVSTKSDISTITELKKKRVNWSSIIKKIANETGNIGDAHYGDSAAYESYGGIVYTGYEFDTVSNKIVLSGISRTLDGTNFTLLSNLIQQLESSPDFEGVEMRSFTKSKSGSGTSGDAYFANFKIDLTLQKKTFSEKDRPSLTEIMEEKNAGAKRNTAIPGLTPLLEKFSEFQSQIKIPFVNSGPDASRPQRSEGPSHQVPEGLSIKKEEKNVGVGATQEQTQAQIQTAEQAQTQSTSAPAATTSPTLMPSAPAVSAPAATTKSASADAPTSASARSAPAVSTKSTTAPAPDPASNPTSKNP